MKWRKKGIIYAGDGQYEWAHSHAQVPFVDLTDSNRLRIYYGTRDSLNRTVTTFIETEAENPPVIKYHHDKPVMELGVFGSFDDCGVMPSWIVNHKNKKYLYYIGWNIGNTARYRLSIGLAESCDNGTTFTRCYTGPIMDRSIIDPYFVSNPCILIENGIWRMWYLSCVKWVIEDNIAEPLYHIRYAESHDGIEWGRKGHVAIDFSSENECGISRPCVIKDSSCYRMWYSYRGLQEYRSNKKTSYRIGYAESNDGIDWTRKDSESGIDVSDSGWDSEMIAYPHVYKYGDYWYMLYNGNGFGKSGFGYAVTSSFSR